MKKTIAYSLTMLMCLGAICAPDDSLQIVKGSHHDFYADGTPVVDGEFYAVVFQKNGVEFAGFNQDGSVLDPGSSKLLCLLPMAKKGKCPPLLLQIAKSFANSLTNGEYKLFMMDTRAKYVDGQYVLAEVASNDAPAFVRGYAEVQSSLGGSKSAYYLAQGSSAPPIEVCAPTITNVVTYANYVDVEKTNIVTQTAYNYVTRCFTQTNVVEVERKKQPIPISKSNKKWHYNGYMRKGTSTKVVGTFEAQMGTLDKFNITTVTFKFKIGKKKCTKTAKCVVDSYGEAFGFFSRKIGAIIFRGKVGVGDVVIDNVSYGLECEVK